MAATSEPPNRSISDVPDILHLVFSYLDPDNHFRDEYDQIHESRRSLALAARTCWGFAGPALDVLWKRLPDDQPLADLLCEVGTATRQVDEEGIKLTGRDKLGRYRLPSQFVIRPQWGRLLAGVSYERRSRVSRGYDIQYLLKDINDPRAHPGWPRFVEYASRVRGITLFAFDEPARSEIWEVLRCRVEGAPILPRLQSVDFYGIPTRALMPGALALLSRSVRNLTFNNLRGGARCMYSALDENQRALFSQSLNSAPNTDKLRLEIYLSCLTPPLLQTHCSHIHHLEIFPPLTLDELQILTKLPVLQQLSIALAGERTPGAVCPTFTFKTLTNLDVEGSWVQLNTLFKTVHLPSVHTLTVTGKAFGTRAVDLAKGAISFFNTLSAARHASLTSLSIRELPPLRRSPTPPGWVLTSGAALLIPGVFEAPFLDLIHPLLSLSALRHFSLSVPTHYNLVCTGADLRALAEAFRGLESFHLRMYRPLERPRGGPLDALEHFARNCPRLRLLHLPSMEMAEESLAMVNVDDGGLLLREPHGLQMLVIPKVLLPPGRPDLAGKVSELVRQVFPLAAAPFRRERLVET